MFFAFNKIFSIGRVKLLEEENSRMLAQLENQQEELMQHKKQLKEYEEETQREFEVLEALSPQQRRRRRPQRSQWVNTPKKLSQRTLIEMMAAKVLNIKPEPFTP